MTATKPTDEQVRAGADALVRLRTSAPALSELAADEQEFWLRDARAVVEAAGGPAGSCPCTCHQPDRCPCLPGAPAHKHGAGGYCTIGDRGGACTCPDVDVTTAVDQPGSRTMKGLDPACQLHGARVDRPTTAHVIAFDAVGTWTMEHPPSCRPAAAACPVRLLAERQITSDLTPLVAGGRYTCSAGPLGDVFQLYERLHDDQCTTPVCAACGCWCHAEEQSEG